MTRAMVLGCVTGCLLAARSGQAADEGALVSVAAPRPVTVRVQTASADVEVSRSPEAKVVLLVADGDVGAVRLVARGPDVLEAEFDGRDSLPSGQVRLRLPAGSRIEIRTQSGDIVARDLGGEAQVRSLSGDILLEGAVGVDLRTVSGDARVDAAGTIRMQTVSGDLDLRQTAGKAARSGPSTMGSTTIVLESTSGDIRWSGRCASGCQLRAATVSGDTDLNLDGGSSFALTMQSHSGDLEDELGLVVTRRGGRRAGADVAGRFGKGEGKSEGSIDCRSFSGDVRLRRR